MSVSFLNYFENEMNFLVEATKNFKEEYPTMESFDFAANSTDPDIKKLLEGVAFLNANLHKRIDQKNLESNQEILNLIYPYFNRPTPSFCIFQVPQIEKTLTIPKNTPILSEIKKTNLRYTFVSTYETKLSPFSIKNITTINSSILPKEINKLTSCAIEIEIEKLFNKNENEIIMYINTNNSAYETIYEQLLTFYTDCNTPVFENDRQIGEIVAFNDMDIIPTKANESKTFHPIIEYNTFKNKFMFFKIKLWKQPIKHLHIPVKDKTINLTKDTFLLNCIVGVNIIEKASDPIFIDHSKHKYKLVIPKNLDLYEIDYIKNIQPTDYQYIKYFSLEYNKRQSQDILWSLKEDYSLSKTKYLYFYNNNIKEQTVYAKMMCIQKNANEDIVENETWTIPNFNLKCINLHKPTKYKSKMDQIFAQRTLISHLFINYFGLDSENMLLKLQELFNLYNTEHINCISLIKNIEIRTRMVPSNGNIIPKMDVIIKADDSPKVFLLSQIIAKLLVNNVNMNTKLTLILKKETSNEVWKICDLI